MIRLAIKGDEPQARAELAARGLTATLVHAGAWATFWDAPEASRPALVAWFCEGPNDPPEGGYPPGTLLHHS